MPKKSKIQTPEWILEGYDSEEEYNKLKGIKKEKKKSKAYKIRECPECSSDDVGVVLSGSDDEEGGGNEWECRKCEWKGSNIKEKEVSEDEFLEYMERRV